VLPNFILLQCKVFILIQKGANVAKNEEILQTGATVLNEGFVIMVCADEWIIKKSKEEGMIEPFEEGQVRSVDGRQVISYGVSSYGYDIRVSRHFRIFTNVHGAVVDPKAFDPKGMVEVEADTCLIPPNSFALALSVEYFRIPRNVITLCVGKSTYARCGIIVNVTPFEPGWEGQAVLEISNTTQLPAKVYAGEGLAQVLFFEGNMPCRTTYADRKGKYQHQEGIVLPRL
jgi:dCTP deaminase